MTNKLRLIIFGLTIVTAPLAAHSQLARTPQQYCTKLTKDYDRYIASSHGAEQIASHEYGEAACKEHQAAAAIPVLEKALEAAKLPLPPHAAAIAGSEPRGTSGPNNS